MNIEINVCFYFLLFKNKTSSFKGVL